MNWKFISFSVEMGGQEDFQLRGCKFMFPVRISSCMYSLRCAGVGLWLLQGLHWLINYKKNPLIFCTADLYHHKSHIRADVELISHLVSTARLLQAQAVEGGLKK